MTYDYEEHEESDCCGAPVKRLTQNTINVFGEYICVNHPECTHCGKPCELNYPQEESEDYDIFFPDGH